MKPRKCFALLLLLCTLALLCTACASTTALDNIATYYSEVGAVLDDWVASSSGGGVSGGGEGAAAAALDAPGSFTLDENGNYSFTGVADADYYLVYFCAPDATSDSDPFLFSSNSIDATGTGGETYSGSIDDLVQYGYGEYLVKVFAFPSLNDASHAMSTAATATYSFSGAQDAPVIEYLWNTFDGTVDVQLSNIDTYMYQAYPDSVEVTFTNTADPSDTVVVTIEDLSADHYSATSDALTRGATYDITAVNHSENAYVTNGTSDTAQVAQGVTFGGHNVISADYYYTDGTFRFDQYSEMPPQGPSHIEGIWTDNGDGTANLSVDHSTLRTSLDPDY